MALARWTPRGNLQSFQDEMNRMFDQFFRGGTGEEAGWGVRTWAPPVQSASRHPLHQRGIHSAHPEHTGLKSHRGGWRQHTSLQG
jgi:hypothetical protein